MPKYLIIRFSSAGDIVLTTPVIRCLKKQTGAEVHFLTKKAFLPLIEANPYLDKIFSIEKNILEVLKELRSEKYDAIIDLHRNMRSKRVGFELNVPTYAFDKINVQKWLMTTFKINRLPDRHIVDRYLETVKSFGVENDGEGLDYFLPNSDEMMQKSISGKIPKLDFEKPFIAFAIGAAHQTKRIPEELILKICRNANLPIVLLGGPGEKQEGERIVSSISEGEFVEFGGSNPARVRDFDQLNAAQSNAPKVISTCGKLNWHESAFLIKKSQKVITPDTGMMHIAAAFKKEIISIWGNTIPEFGMYPYFGDSPARNTIFEVKNLSCRPCSKIGYKKCPKGHFKCMREQNVEGIILEIGDS